MRSGKPPGTKMVVFLTHYCENGLSDTYWDPPRLVVHTISHIYGKQGFVKSQNRLTRCTILPTIYMHCSYISGWKDVSWLVGIMDTAACEYVLRYRGVSLFRTHRHVHCIYMCSEAVTAVYTVERYPGHQPTNLPRHQPSRTSPI